MFNAESLPLPRVRILHVAKKFPNLIGGDASAVEALARTQRRSGHEVFVVTSNAHEVREDPTVFRVGPLQNPEALDRITPKRVRTMLALRRWSRRELPRIRPDVVHSHSPDLGVAVAAAADRAGAGRVHTCHGLWFPLLGPLSFRGRVELALLRRGAYHTVVTVDRAAEVALRSRGFPRAVCVPNGVDADEFSGPQREPAVFRFLFAGRHEPQKGLDVLVEAVSRLRSRGGPRFEVVLLGEGSQTAGLRRRVHDLGLADIVTFAGPLDRPSLVSAYLGASAFVLPSRFEGFPMALMEAWAAGLPVVATSVGGVREVSRENAAILVPPENPDALAEALSSLLADPRLRQDLASTGRHLARERFAWNAISARYGEIYEAARAHTRESRAGSPPGNG